MFTPGLLVRVEARVVGDRVPVPWERVPKDGSITAGPAPKPLPWLRMWSTDDGELMVDRATKVPAKKEYVRA